MDIPTRKLVLITLNYLRNAGKLTAGSLTVVSLHTYLTVIFSVGGDVSS